MITWYKEPMVAEVGGITLFTKKKSASSGLRLILFLGFQVVDFEDSVIRDPCTHCRTWWGSRTVQLWDLREPGTSFCPNRQSWVNIQVSYSVCFLEYLVSFNISRSPLGSLACWQVAWQQENTGCFHYFRVAHYHAIAIHIHRAYEWLPYCVKKLEVTAWRNTSSLPRNYVVKGIPGLWRLLNDDRNPVRVFPPDLLPLGSPLLKRVLLLVLKHKSQQLRHGKVSKIRRLWLLRAPYLGLIW